MPVKFDAASLEVNVANHSQDIAKKQFQQQLTLEPHKQNLLHNAYMEYLFVNKCPPYKHTTWIPR